KVVRLTDFGAFIELEPGVDGLLHISQMSNRPINRPDEIVSVGDELTLFVIRVDPNERRIGRSLKVLAHAIEPPKPEESPRGRRGKRGKYRDEFDDDENSAAPPRCGDRRGARHLPGHRLALRGGP